MQVNLKPCPYRLVDHEGHILCHQIKFGEREVSPAICRACPIAQINCSHLRATLIHQARTPLTVRWGNGKTEIWDDPSPPLSLGRAACSAKTIPILSPRDCAGCVLRQALATADAIPALPTVSPDDGRRTAKRTPRLAPAPMVPATQPEPTTAAHTNIVAQKIIQLQEWLARQKKVKREKEEGSVMPLAVGVRSVRAAGEERRVGWTD